ncbi:MAG: LLM class F420-dependent oxidoreductase [Candidatus Binatia bacterium]|nr:LLM class F420-dependent oxidoreductase [Candidatus Binatia bacterium]
MELGLTIFFTDSSIGPVELALAAEERAFESLWVAEHSHIPTSRATPFPGGGDLPKMYYDVMDPFVTLSAAAAVTKNLKIGTGICLVPQRDPIQTAKSVASLDQISKGRFLFGVGGGWNVEEAANHGAKDFKGRWKLMRERIEAMKAIWKTSKAEYHGDLVDFDPIYAWPKPVQKGGPPVHVAGMHPHGPKRAVRYGDGWVPINPGRKVLGSQIADFKQMCRDAGREELPVTLFGAPGKAESLAGSRDVGVSRAVFALPPAPRDEILPLLDRFVQLRDEIG